MPIVTSESSSQSPPPPAPPPNLNSMYYHESLPTVCSKAVFITHTKYGLFSILYGWIIHQHHSPPLCPCKLMLSVDIYHARYGCFYSRAYNSAVSTKRDGSKTRQMGPNIHSPRFHVLYRWFLTMCGLNWNKNYYQYSFVSSLARLLPRGRSGRFGGWS